MPYRERPEIEITVSDAEIVEAELANLLSSISETEHLLERLKSRYNDIPRNKLAALESYEIEYIRAHLQNNKMFHRLFN